MVVAKCVEAYGRIDVLVLNAGTPCNLIFHELDDESEGKLREVREREGERGRESMFYCVELLTCPLLSLSLSLCVCVSVCACVRKSCMMRVKGSGVFFDISFLR